MGGGRPLALGLTHSSPSLTVASKLLPLDVFAYGVVLWELLTWQLPWSHEQDPWRVRPAGAAAAVWCAQL